MAEVFLAEALGAKGFSKPVALKLIRPEFQSDPDFLRWFTREGLIGGHLSHPNIVEILDLGLEGERLYLVMELIEGPTLDHVLKVFRSRQEALPLDVVLEIVIQICRGLQHAHGAQKVGGGFLQTVHCDIKPANILLSKHGVAKLADFGIARAAGAHMPVQQSGVVRGTVAYMSPEQALGEPGLSPSSDLFSLGLVLYEMLTLQQLYTADTVPKVLRLAQDAETRLQLDRIPPGQHQASLQALLTRTLAREPQERPSSAAELAAELSELLRKLPERHELGRWLLENCQSAFPVLAPPTADSGPGWASLSPVQPQPSPWPLGSAAPTIGTAVPGFSSQAQPVTVCPSQPSGMSSQVGLGPQGVPQTMAVGESLKMPSGAGSETCASAPEAPLHTTLPRESQVKGSPVKKQPPYAWVLSGLGLLVLLALGALWLFLRPDTEQASRSPSPGVPVASAQSPRTDSAVSGNLGTAAGMGTGTQPSARPPAQDVSFPVISPGPTAAPQASAGQGTATASGPSAATFSPAPDPSPPAATIATSTGKHTEVKRPAGFKRVVASRTSAVLTLNSRPPADLIVDGAPVGDTARGAFGLRVPTGRHCFQFKVKDRLAGLPDKDICVEVTEAGLTCFTLFDGTEIRCKVSGGTSAATEK